ncbi:hypothetical protein [Sporichthya sp.]|uniref:hypothetical protein n=1 Tax=Sporichthya sp. TaxID=65475 RepID=UPI00183DA2B2|nr:hypothetical protein [Sporichthya sp.]MBA3745673.1 hypothetical protein [Sporichthya sp.]
MSATATDSAPGEVLAPAAPVATAKAVCTQDAPTLTTVRSYPRRAVAELAGGSSPLYCGNTKFGLRHIVIRHTADWRAAAAAAPVVVPWPRFVDTALATTLARPQSVRCDARRDTCALRGAPTPEQEVVVVVARADGKVITAYPLEQ